MDLRPRQYQHSAMVSPPFGLAQRAASSRVYGASTRIFLPHAQKLYGGAESDSSVDEGFQSGSEDGDVRRLLCTILPEPPTTAVDAPFQYTGSLPSKGVREKLIQALNVWLALPQDSLNIVNSVIFDVHTLSLMLDDVEDNSPLRRSRPSTHNVFGVAQTINAATYRIVEVVRRSMGTRNPKLLSVVVEEMQSLMVGQSLDLIWTYQVSAPSVEEYLQMVDGKTGGLFRMASKLMATLSQSPKVRPTNLNNLMTLLGRYFQIRDDYMNLASVEYTQTKGFCEDLDEGKYSFILLHALETCDRRTRTLLDNMLLERRAAGKAGPGHKELVLSILEQTKSLQYTVDMLSALSDEILDIVGAIETATGEPNKPIRDLFAALEIKR
ncbi:GGPP synthase A [Diaporthe sp. PMI_573]|nr:GGPP synthase A [Diaporthaceae sp. PMI_573]